MRLPFFLNGSYDRPLAGLPQAVQETQREDRSRLREALVASLSEDDATVETRHRFRLRRPSEYADYELRVEDMRIFYRVAGNEVRVVLVGRKRGNHLLVDGRRFTL